MKNKLFSPVCQLVVISGLMFSACENTENRNKQVVRDFYANVASPDELHTYFAPGFIDHNPPPGMDVEGPEGVGEVFASFLEAFPDMSMTVKSITAERDQVSVLVEFNGTHQGSLGDIPATGNPVSFDIFSLMRFENGKIAERRGMFEEMKLLIQLGVVSPPGVAEPAEPLFLPAGNLRWEQIDDAPEGLLRVRLWGDSSTGPYGEFIRFPAGFEAPSHYHSNDLKLIVISGAYTYRPEGGSETRYGPGSFLMIPGGTEHRSGGITDSETVFYMHSEALFDLVDLTD
jgi:predicted ester cyclase/mannose-6-phosphate isomerase-like protein (cupin superfamily)